MVTPGIDISKYQVSLNGGVSWAIGDRFAFNRATIGDYYTDEKLLPFWQAEIQSGHKKGVYLVTAPKDPTLSRFINASQHLARFYPAIAGLTPDMPHVIDAELTRGASPDYITELHYQIVTNIYSETGRYPIIYTRQSWWDYNILPSSLWSKCPLFAARYFSGGGPWSDGNYKFRDWDDWVFWQYTAHGSGPAHGVESGNIDLDYFHGDEAALDDFCNTGLTIEQQLAILWREAGIAGWNLLP
jgi:GH25 family lysozyme M1 (1,4-beta-N-acetylmuramidase)